MPRSRSPISSSPKKSSAEHRANANVKKGPRERSGVPFFASELVRRRHQPGKAFRRDGQPALAQPAADRVPVVVAEVGAEADPAVAEKGRGVRSEEHRSELQSLMRH